MRQVAGARHHGGPRVQAPGLGGPSGASRPGPVPPGGARPVQRCCCPSLPQSLAAPCTVCPCPSERSCVALSEAKFKAWGAHECLSLSSGPSALPAHLPSPYLLHVPRRLCQITSSRSNQFTWCHRAKDWCLYSEFPLGLPGPVSPRLTLPQ